MPGDSFTYDFVVTRAGLFWYHPHVRGAQGVFEGLYGPLIVDDPDEPALRDLGVLPKDERVLVLADLSELGGAPWSVEVDNPMEVMNGTEGEHLLVDGREDPVFEVAAGEPVRLRIVNSSITRFWRLAVPGHTLYRIGGQGGLLDRVRVEGGNRRRDQRRQRRI
jgi:FtsP/CotA-like multicopper oxidase with cupredoxin domain